MRTSLLPYLTLFGILIYPVIYSLAVADYPGGSDNFPANAEGYSFFHNYLCDAMEPFSQNGSFNPARSMAIISHFILGLTMIMFFYLLPELFHFTNRKLQMTRMFGMQSMFIFLFMFTPLHDLIVILTALFGTIALIPFFYELFKSEYHFLKTFAMICFGMSLLVFIGYTTKYGEFYLPLLQKITFVIDATWVVWVCVLVIGKQKSMTSQNTDNQLAFSRK